MQNKKPTTTAHTNAHIFTWKVYGFFSLSAVFLFYLHGEKHTSLLKNNYQCSKCLFYCLCVCKIQTTHVSCTQNWLQIMSAFQSISLLHVQICDKLCDKRTNSSKVHCFRPHLLCVHVNWSLRWQKQSICGCNMQIIHTHTHKAMHNNLQFQFESMKFMLPIESAIRNYYDNSLEMSFFETLPKIFLPLPPSDWCFYPRHRQEIRVDATRAMISTCIMLITKSSDKMRLPWNRR